MTAAMMMPAVEKMMARSMPIMNASALACSSVFEHLLPGGRQIPGISEMTWPPKFMPEPTRSITGASASPPDARSA